MDWVDSKLVCGFKSNHVCHSYIVFGVLDVVDEEANAKKKAVWLETQNKLDIIWHQHLAVTELP